MTAKNYFPCIALSGIDATKVVPAGGDNVASAPLVIISLIILALLAAALWLYRISEKLSREEKALITANDRLFDIRLTALRPKELDHIISKNKSKDATSKKVTGAPVIIGVLLLNIFEPQQTLAAVKRDDVFSSPGLYITLVLVGVPLFLGLLFLVLRLSRVSRNLENRRQALAFEEIITLSNQDDNAFGKLLHRRQALNFKLSGNELAGNVQPSDERALLSEVEDVHETRLFAPKQRSVPRQQADPELVRLVLWHLGVAAFWLIAGTSIGEYLGIKFVSPEIDNISWLSFGRLRPVHTNMVFWGWSTLAMLGLGYYVISTVSNVKLYSIRWGYHSLILISTAVILGSVCLMAGVNNGGGEYREYIWPVMLIFAVGIAIALTNSFKTIARRKTDEIYISNWYIVAATMFLIVIVIIAYAPWWQNGLGETVIQGYYMHQGVGMWFMLFNLGLIYYFLPQHLNAPIYSYGLGILAFWSQILFYTLIGTHHFIFSAIPWWLQTVAIVGSMGMLIPVLSGTTNFLMTIKGNFHQVFRSYTLPFFIVGIVFYFTGSLQGTAEAFRATNQVWHFTDFTIAHSHMTMYGIIAFMLWGCIYTLLPRLTGKEPPQAIVGAHFWLALLGVLIYSIPLMIGGTLKGLSWMEGKPFIESVRLMAPYWLWRAIGGSLMWLSHLAFGINILIMIRHRTSMDVPIDRSVVARDPNHPSLI